MPPKRPRKHAGRGRPKQTSALPRSRPPLSPSSSHHSDDDSNNHFSYDEGQHRPLSDSNASSLVTVLATAATVAASLESTSSEAPDDTRKRARKTPFCLADEEEKSMLEFMQENPLLWDIKLTDYRRTDKKNKLWEEQAVKLSKTADYLKGWFKSLRNNFTRLDKKKSRDGAPDLTEREQWVKDNFSFMKAATRHRPEPVNSVSISYFTWRLIIELSYSIFFHFSCTTINDESDCNMLPRKMISLCWIRALTFQ